MPKIAKEIEAMAEERRNDEVLLFTDSRCLEHRPPPTNPERPARLEAILTSLENEPVHGARMASALPAAEEDLIRIHDEAYVEEVLSYRGRSVALDLDTSLSPHSVDAALLAAGAGIQAVTAVCEGDSKRAFVLVRPPGHHAERGRGMGFCIFNNIAIAAAHAVERLGRRRILLVDWDVHHGNGTQEAFWSRNDILFFSTHRSPPFYPGTGHLHEVGVGEGEGATVNVPLPSGLGDVEFVRIFQEILEPIADAYRPDLVLVSAGFDPHQDDPLGGMRMTSAGFGALCSILRGIAERHADGKIVLFLEGGYDLPGLVDGVRSCMESLTAEEAERPSPATPTPVGLEEIEKAKAFHLARHGG